MGCNADGLDFQDRYITPRGLICDDLKKLCGLGRERRREGMIIGLFFISAEENSKVQDLERCFR